MALFQSQIEDRILQVATVDTSPPRPRKEPKPKKDKISWIIPYGCKAKLGTILIGNASIAPRCGSRACLGCHCCKLTGTMSSALEMDEVEGEQLYSLVMTPKQRVFNRDDVKSFLCGVRETLNRWRRYYDLGYAYWVSECVVKWFEPPTEIPCPVRESVRDGLSAIYSSMSHYYVEAALAVREVIENCLSGGNCPLCRGKGYLPSVHLHVHVAMSTKPFWYGEGPSTVPGLQDFGGRGLKGLVDSAGVGFTSVEELRKKEGIAAYISKACMLYMSKVSGLSTSRHDQDKVQDWCSSQDAAMIASAIYGENRHRGTVGRAYGLRYKKKDPKLSPQFISNGIGDDSLGVHLGTGELVRGGHAIAALDGRLEAEVVRSKFDAHIRQIADGMDPESRIEFHSLKLGKKAARSGALGSGVQRLSSRETINVLIKTEVDGVSSTVEDGSFDWFYEQNFGRIFVRHSGGSSVYFAEAERVCLKGFSEDWCDTYIVGSCDYWFSPFEEGCVLGKGSTVTFLDRRLYDILADVDHWLLLFRKYGYHGVIQELREVS